MEIIYIFALAVTLAALTIIYLILRKQSSTQNTVSTNTVPAVSEQPPDVNVLGRSAWTLIHTMAVRYPDNPTAEDKKTMLEFLAALSEFYPCGLCASHLREYLRNRPADVSSRTALQQWLCALHNSVNTKLKKPVFDCDLVGNRWGGPIMGPIMRKRTCDSRY